MTENEKMFAVMQGCVTLLNEIEGNRGVRLAMDAKGYSLEGRTETVVETLEFFEHVGLMREKWKAIPLAT